ncbi:MAG: AAA family ATPase [Methylophilus sp.]|nr:AAA family ATPase [Methylophilus sp.]
MAESNLPQPPWSFDHELTWQLVDRESFKDFLTKVWRVHPSQLPADAKLYVMDLPFYSEHKLYCLLATVEGELRHCFTLRGKFTKWLDGTSPPIHEINAHDPINLDSMLTTISYLRFFCSFVYGDLGPFLPVESAASIQIPNHLDAQERQHADGLLMTLRSVVTPIMHVEETSDGNLFTASILYGDVMFSCQLLVSLSGSINMVNDSPMVSDIPKGMIPVAPKAYGINDLLIDDFEKNDLEERDDVKTPPSIVSQGLSNNAQQSAAPQQAAILPANGQTVVSNKPKFSNDRDITRCYVSVLVRHALEKDPNYDVITDFNKVASRNDVVNDFSKYVLKNGPVVLVESEIPYIEEMLADLIAEHLHYKTPTIKRITRSETELKEQNSTTFVIFSAEEVSVASYGYGTPNLERLAFDISKTKHPVFIGTNNKAGLSDALHQVVEYTVSIPKLNVDLFKILFEKILGGNLPRGWRNRNTQWIRYLTPHDFHQPCKAGLSGTKAYKYLQERVKNRLKSIEATNSPGLQDLHGMAEAKQMAEDLISDIQGALKGQLPWSAVDRGMLLAGPPGTGKTTLAKAIAKGCGVRFIAVSAATWQSAGALPEHLRAMRASFAEARRYAPSILFIDEVDSFSNRDNQVGQNASYFTEVVNALLAEIQGFDEQKPVFVIGATNFPYKVDPALRRAGRLDKLVYIPHPNVEALTSIYEYYLSNKELVGQKADDIDTKFLGGISFGVTGADVETFVRGAVRRARKDQQPLCQQHLIDEITGKSRSQNTSRLSTEEMRQVAVHESGHALLQLLCGHAPIAYVSIVPRENGALGFVANLPSGQKMLSRKQYLEQMQIMLAGRAAEEIVFGRENITSGAGGESPNSDLAIATRLATNLVCNLGMGKTSTLIWGNTPSADQQEEIEKLLQEAYSTALAKLEAHRKSLDTLSKALVEKQELMGGEIIDILNKLGLKSGKIT